jgi:ADP-ribose pyrophosphatase YjhB (NUDIX family)
VVSTVPDFLDWGRRLQAIAQSGLAYGEPSVHDRERYEQIRRIAAEMIASNGEIDALDRSFASQVGHATPKLDVRGAVFRDGEILLVREKSDGGWTLPGGWVDVGESPSESVTREIREESGYSTRAVKLIALYDRDRHDHPLHAWHVWKAVFLCELDSSEQAPLEDETTDASFFPADGLPSLSLMRVTPQQIERFFEHGLHPEWPADFD